MRKRTLWTAPVLPGKGEVISHRWRSLLFDPSDPDQVRLEEEVADRVGLTDFGLWLQRSDRGDLVIYLFETDSWDQLWSEFRALLDEGHPRATLVQKEMFDCLGVDVSVPDFAPEPEMLAHYEWGKLPASQVVRFAQSWPLLPGREASRRAFSSSCNEENRDAFETLSKSLGLISLSRGIAHCGSQGYYVVSGECDVESWSRYREFLRSDDNSWIWDKLIEDTGLTRHQLIPHIEWISESPPITTLR